MTNAQRNDRCLCIVCGCLIDGEAGERGNGLHEVCAIDGRAIAWAALKCFLNDGGLIPGPKFSDPLNAYRFPTPGMRKGSHEPR